jgi:hypothetical protein
MTDINALRALAAQIQPGWTVDITDHDYLSDSREGAVVESVTADQITVRPRRPWSSQGRRFRTMRIEWDDRDLEVDGYVLRLYTTPASTTSRSTRGVRRIVKTFWFRPPRAV